MATEHDKRVMAHLVPEKHPQGDFFVLDMHDANPRDDLASMEHPLFALRAGDKRIRTYERNGHAVQVQPGAFGCATIHDKDIWLFCISQLVGAQNKGREISRTVRFTAHEFLIATNRRTDGDSYERMSAAMDRLKGTTIKTDIKTDGRRERGWFGLIESARVIERDKDERMVAIEITLPEWLYRSIKANQVKAINRDYFRLRKPLDRRIYELARKHCGDQPKWCVGIKTLHQKSGSGSKLFKFRAAIKSLVEARVLPDYHMAFDAQADAITFYNRGPKGGQEQLRDVRKSLRS